MSRWTKTFLWDAGLILVVAFIATMWLFDGSFIALFKFGVSRGMLATATLVIVAYLLLRIFLSRLVTSTIIIAFTFILYKANMKKIAFTGEPIAWRDLTNWNAILLSLRYIDFANIILLLGFIFIFFIAVLYEFRRDRFLPRKAIGLLLFLTVGVSYYLGNSIYGYTIAYANWQKLSYQSWDWPRNAKSNGLLFHLLQTSQRAMPPVPNEMQRKQFANLSYGMPQSGQNEADVIFILCEACWYQDNIFLNAFTVIERENPVQLRAISPIYGGGTPNATFEILTGLPSNGTAITGIIYQEYSNMFSEHSKTIPAAFQSAGYKTYSAHNYHKKFWNRDIVEPLLGFDKFYGIEDIKDYVADPKFTWPRDSWAFNFARNLLNEDRSSPIFLHIATMFTHGPYKKIDGDLGQTDYETRFKIAMDDLAAFVHAVREKKPDTIIVVYGDHKPGLTEYFATKADQVSLSEPHSRGDVPVFIFDRNQKRANSFAKLANGKPLYCLARDFSAMYMNLSLPVFEFTGETCSHYNSENYEVSARSVPDYVYSLSLFDR